MSYRDSDDVLEEKKRSPWYWPDLDSLDESYAVARKAFGGWVFAGMIVLGAVVTYFSGKSAIDLKTPEADIGGALIGSAVELAFVLFASYRMVTGRGWIVSWFLLAVFAVEVVMKVLGAGPTVVGWLIFYAAVGSSIVAGARACWDIRSRLKAGETVAA